MNESQPQKLTVEIDDLEDYISVLKLHPDYRVSGLVKAAQQRLEDGDTATALQWTQFAVDHLE